MEGYPLLTESRDSLNTYLHQALGGALHESIDLALEALERFAPH